MNRLMISFLIVTIPALLFAQEKTLSFIPAEIDFSESIVKWDGFGFNYVETAQTRNYDEYQQDYGGFSFLSEETKREILNHVFGEEGLQIQIMKMFLDPYHQKTPDSQFDHLTTTRNMRYFVKEGQKITENRKDKLEIITTLYGPPAWATQQKFIGGRDLDTSQITNLCNYMANWLSFLKQRNYPVKYLSTHNEGEDFYRWDFNKSTQRFEHFDFNMYWTPNQVNTFLKELPKALDKYKLNDIGLTNGEPSNWSRFYFWGYTDGLVKDQEALANLDLLTTHGFINGDQSKLSYSTANDLTTNALRDQKPGLHAWVTSFSWKNMGNDFIRMAHENIYLAKVNALIPWAGIQVAEEWISGDPNSGCAIAVNKDGSYELRKGYYFYKQLTSAGRRGMTVARASLANPQAYIIAFSGGESGNPDAFVLSSNIFVWSLPVKIEIRGSNATCFKAYRSSEDMSEMYSYIGEYNVENGCIIYDPPKGTTTTFIAVDN